MPAEAAKSIGRIFSPTDYSPASGAAFEQAERIVACTGASLLVLHAQPRLRATAPSGQADNETTQALSKVQPHVSGVHIEDLVHGGSPGEVIRWVAQERDCDQIVMSRMGAPDWPISCWYVSQNMLSVTHDVLS